MKKIVPFLFLIIGLTSCFINKRTPPTPKNITLTFEQDATDAQKNTKSANYEEYLIQNLINFKIDTLKVVDGKVSIPNNTTDITPFAVARIQPRQALIFFVEPKKDFELKLSETQFTIKSVEGSISQNEYTAFLNEQEKIQKESQLAQGAINKVKNKDSLRNRVTYLQMQMNAKFIDFLNYQKDNNLGAYMIYDVANKNQRMAANDVLGLFNKLDENGKKTHFGKEVSKRIKRLTAMDIGSEAPDFTLLDKNGKKHTLSSLRDKYVLVDFWASWCGPCVKEIPHLKTAYKKYKSKGFEIMSVSIDRKKEQWYKALNKYDMPWISVIDYEKMEDKVTQKLYYVPTIPRTILLDKKGIVIGKDFRGPALEHKLAELFK